MGLLSQMAIPKFDETFLPTLKVLQDGRTIKTRELPHILLAQGYFKLTDEELEEKTATGARLFFDRVSWGKSYLKQGKFVEQPERGLIKISEKGLALLADKKHLDLSVLQSDSDFLAYRRKSAVISKKSKAIVDGDVTPQEVISMGITELENSLKRELVEQLKTVDPYYFEVVILKLFKSMGYGEFTRTSRSGDGGVDGIINQDALGVEKIYTQAKRYVDHPVGGRDMTNFIGAISRDGVNKGIFVTTSSFSTSAIEMAQRARDTIVLIDGEKLVDLMIEYNVGVQIKTEYKLKEIDEDFFNAES